MLSTRIQRRGANFQLYEVNISYVYGRETSEAAFFYCTKTAHEVKISFMGRGTSEAAGRVFAKAVKAASRHFSAAFSPYTFTVHNSFE